MIVLYHCVSARSFRPLWMLEELGAPYELRMLPFPPRALQRSYLEINPLGTMPLSDRRRHAHDRVGRDLPVPGRSAATRDNRRGLAVRPDEPGFGAWLNWLHHGEATLTFPQTIVLRYGRFEPDERKLPQAAEDYAQVVPRAPARHRRGAAAADFLCADRFTAADISVGYALMLADELDLVSRFPPAVAAYWERLQQRDGFRRALAAQHEAALAQGVSLAVRHLTEWAAALASPCNGWTSTIRCSRAWRCRWCWPSRRRPAARRAGPGARARAGRRRGVAVGDRRGAGWVLGWRLARAP